MQFVQPIRNREHLEAIKKVLKDQSERNWMLFVAGANTGLRISDLLQLRVRDVKNKKHIRVKEKKTGKTKDVPVTVSMRPVFRSYVGDKDDRVYLFRSRKGNNKPLTRSGAYSVLRKAADAVGIPNIGTHTLRKTFGYWFYQTNKEFGTLMLIFNHSDPAITKRYIGIQQDEIDASIEKMPLI